LFPKKFFDDLYLEYYGVYKAGVEIPPIIEKRIGTANSHYSSNSHPF